MDKARIYKPNRSTMQAGRAKSNDWVLEFEPKGTRYIEPLMLWTGTRYTKRQVQLHFKTREEAVAFAEKNEIPFVLLPVHPFQQHPKSYSQNFAYNKVR
jgi:hypothetical protein